MKKKPLIFLAVIVLLGLIGGTFAYYSSNAQFTNKFDTAEYGSTTTETFTSPDNWLPGTTTTKTVTVENTGDVPIAVRAKVTSQKWTSKSGKNLELKQGNKDVAVINYNTTSSNWTYVAADGYYYYKNSVASGASTVDSFINSVTFNKDTEPDLTCTSTATSSSCKSSGNGYDGAKYELVIQVETIQADQRTAVWGH